jgi:hypothetical protein
MLWGPRAAAVGGGNCRSRGRLLSRRSAAPSGIIIVSFAGIFLAYTAFRILRSVRLVTREEHTLEPLSNSRNRTPFGAQYFRNASGLFIFWRRWLPVSPRGCVILVHGFGEHSGRYEHVAAALTEVGWAVYACDHQGHGASEGDRAYTKRFDDFADDVLQVPHAYLWSDPCVLMWHADAPLPSCSLRPSHSNAIPHYPPSCSDTQWEGPFQFECYERRRRRASKR